MRPGDPTRQQRSQAVVSNAQFRKYSEVISAWQRRYDTNEIARLLDLPEDLVARWIANFQDMKHGTGAAA
jgi:hypothetical protein